MPLIACSPEAHSCMHICSNNQRTQIMSNDEALFIKKNTTAWTFFLRFCAYMTAKTEKTRLLGCLGSYLYGWILLNRYICACHNEFIP